MSHPPELEALPTAGSLVGRHLIVREIAKGTVGPLYLARTQNNNQGSVSAIDTLARVIPLPADLPAKDDQFIAEAIWDSANVGHDLVLRVADVIAGKGWVTLVHDHHVGSLVASMHRRARELGSSFPSDVAARMALDVLEGLEQSRGLCETNRIPWRAGSIAIGSLYLCGDGRTRALDGQVVAAVMRSPHMRMLCGTACSVAPEMLDEAWEPDERTDVFAVGAVLWEILTGREIFVDPNAPIANVILSVPKGTQVPQGLVYALHRALELDPNRRQSTLRELAVEVVMGAEKVATYEQVVEFASTLLPFEAAFQPEPSVPPPAYAQPSNMTAVAAQADISWEQQPEPARAEPEPAPTPAPAPVAEKSAPRFASPFAPLTAAAKPATPSQPAAAAPDTAEQIPAAAAPATAPATADDIATAAAPATAPNPAIGGDAIAQSAIVDLGSKPTGARLEQISWPDDENAPLAAASKLGAIPVEPVKKSNGARPAITARDQLDTIPGSSTAGRLEDAKAQSQKPLDKDPSAIRLDAAASKPADTSVKAFRRDSARPTTGAKSAVSSASLGSTKSRPTTSRPVEGTAASNDELIADVMRKASLVANKGAAKGADDGVLKKKGGLQVSMTTLVLGFSTTVLAVVLIMILVQYRSAPNAPATPSPVTHAAQPGDRVAAQPAAAQPEAEQDRSAAQRASTVSSKSTDAAATAAAPADAKTDAKADAKVETKADVKAKRSARSGAAAKASTGDDSTSDDSKGQKKPKTYVPNDL